MGGGEGEGAGGEDVDDLAAGNFGVPWGIRHFREESRWIVEGGGEKASRWRLQGRNQQEILPLKHHLHPLIARCKGRRDSQ